MDSLNDLPAASRQEVVAAIQGVALGVNEEAAKVILRAVGDGSAGPLRSGLSLSLPSGSARLACSAAERCVSHDNPRPTGVRASLRRRGGSLARLKAAAPPGHTSPHGPRKSAAGRTETSMIRQELSRLFAFGERHRRLAARLVLALAMSTVVFITGTLLIWTFETGQKGGDIHGLGDAAFFTGVQLLTVSSSVTNPLTSAGKIIDVILEMWAIFVVTAVAGSFATFFSSGDSS